MLIRIFIIIINDLVVDKKNVVNLIFFYIYKKYFMKIKTQPDSVNWEEVKVKLQGRFPEYKVSTRTKGFIIVAKSGTIGTNVLVRKKFVNVVGNFPTMGATLVFTLCIVLLGFLKCSHFIYDLIVR